MTKNKGSRRGKKHGGYQSPGVYVEEISSGSKPIEGVGTSTAAFVGLAPLNLKRAGVTVLVVALVVWALGSRSAH
jgi:hypothetical protein